MRRLVTWLAVLGALAAGLDVGARLVAQSVVSDRLQEAAALPQRPEVDVGGWPFLAQVVGGEYRDVRVRTGTVPTAGVDLAALDVRLRGVSAPLGQALRGELSSLPVAALDGTAVLAYAELAAAGRALRLRVAPAADGVRVTGSLEVLREQVEVTAVSRVRLAGDALLVTATRYEVGGAQAPAAVVAALGGRLDLRIPLDRLPYGLRVTAASVGPDGVRLAVSGSDVVLRAGRPARAAALSGA